MYEFVRGPMMWVSFIIFIAGLLYQAYRIFRITGSREIPCISSEDEKDKAKGFERILQYLKFEWIIRKIQYWRSTGFKGTVLGTQPGITALTFIFHVSIIITPIFLLAHNVLLFQSFQFSIFSFSELTTDILTVVFLVSALTFLLRRIFVSRVRAVSKTYDYLLLLITIAPFLTGFLAYHQLVRYDTIVIAHIITGELMLIAVGVTKLGHMIFFFFARLFIGSEYSFRSGSRTW